MKECLIELSKQMNLTVCRQAILIIILLPQQGAASSYKPQSAADFPNRFKPDGILKSNVSFSERHSRRIDLSLSSRLFVISIFRPKVWFQGAAQCRQMCCKHTMYTNSMLTFTLKSNVILKAICTWHTSLNHKTFDLAVLRKHFQKRQ